MNIIQVITELYPAGAERIVANLSIALKNREHNVTVISLQPLPESSVIVDELLENNIQIKTLKLTKFTPWRIFKLKKLIETISNHQLIVHSHLIHANLVCRVNNVFGKRYKLINTIHIAEKRKSKWWHFLLDKLTLRFCNYQTAVSKAAAEHHAKMLKIPSDQIKVVYNGIKQPNTLASKDIKLLKAEWEVDDCCRIIGSVGRLDWQKGYDLLLALLPKLSERIPSGEKWGVVILGEGKERSKLEKLAENIPSNIKFILPGYRKDAADCVGAFDLFVMPSRYEGFGLTLIEAMAHGIPVLCSNADSLPNIVSTYPNGKVADFSDINCLEDITESIRKNKITTTNLLYTTDKMVDNYLKLYK